MMSRSVIVVKETNTSIQYIFSKHISIDVLSKHICIDIMSIITIIIITNTTNMITITIFDDHRHNYHHQNIVIMIIPIMIIPIIVISIIIIIIIITPLIFLSLRLGTIINPSGIQDLGILGYNIQASDFELYVDSI